MAPLGHNGLTILVLRFWHLDSFSHYHGCWCPGSMHSQVINGNGLKVTWYLPWLQHQNMPCEWEINKSQSFASNGATLETEQSAEVTSDESPTPHNAPFAAEGLWYILYRVTGNDFTYIFRKRYLCTSLLLVPWTKCVIISLRRLCRNTLNCWKITWNIEF